MVNQKDTVEIGKAELAELRQLAGAAEARKAKSQARSKARQALIKKYQGEYDNLVKDFGGGAD